MHEADNSDSHEVVDGVNAARDRLKNLDRRELLRRASMLGMGALGVGLAGCRNRPDEDIVLTSTEPTSPQAGAVLTGLVTDLLSGAALAGMAVRLVGWETVETDESGRFEFRVPELGDFGISVRGPGYHVRESVLRLQSNADVNVSLLERNGAVTLSHLDQYARGTGPRKEGVRPRTPGATNRWRSLPVVRIYRRLVDVPKRVASDARIAAMESSILALFGPLTGGALGFAPAIDVRTGTPPDSLSGGATGTIAILQREDSLLGSSHASSISNRFDINRACVYCGVDSTLALFNRMLAHSLGGYVVDDGSPSILNPAGAGDLSSRDVAAARVLYSRAPGSRSADRDPDGVFLNA